MNRKLCDLCQDGGLVENDAGILVDCRCPAGFAHSIGDLSRYNHGTAMATVRSAAQRGLDKCRAMLKAEYEVN